jgi:iron complex outermembrane receptor protein
VQKLSAVFLCSVSVMGFSTPACAQSAPPAGHQPRSSRASAAETQEVPPSASDEAGPPQAQDIIVTGSRTTKNGNSSPSPVSVVTAEDLKTTQPGTSLSDSLNVLPAFAGSRGSSSNPTTTGPAAGGNGAANQLNLRNLGANRTLILMDGKRVPPTLFNGIVDVDIIPQALVQRVDVVTGGVSAVYGSDAIAGVVNYIIDHKLEGFRGEASSGISELGDDSKTDISLAYGTKLGDRAHIEASYEYRREGGIDSRLERPYLRQAGITGAGTTANPFVLQTDLRQSGFPFGGLITTGTLANRVFNTDGILTPFTNGTATGTTGVQIGGDGGYWNSSLLSKQNAHQLFGRFDYQLSDNIRFYAQVSGDLKTDQNQAETAQLNGSTFSRTNAFLPASIQALIPTTEATFRLSRFLANVPRAQATADSKQWVFAAGLEGDLGGYSWNIDYNHGDSRLKTQLANNLNRQKLGYALDAVNSGGSIVCNVTLTNPGLANDCVPFNAFGPTAASAAAIDYVTDTSNYSAITKLDDVSGAVSGSPFSTWAGEVNVALSAEWRKLSFSSNSSSRPQDVVNCTAVRFSNCTVGATLNDFTFGENPAGVSQTVSEVAAEVTAPVLKDSAVLGSINLNGAARYTRYNTSGSYVTWKAGLDWQLTDMLRFRATRSRDIRAPTLYELFAPSLVVQVRPTDLLTNTSPTVPQITTSNPNLTAEIGNTLTAGVVWKPTPKLSFAIDYYKLKISNAVTQINGSTFAFQNACYASGGTSPYCALQVRPGGFTNTAASNAVSTWLINYVNIADTETWGVDFEANYATTLFSRPLSTRLLAAYQPHLYYRQPNVVTLDQGGVGFGPTGFGALPDLRLTGFLAFQPADNVTVSVQERWRNSLKLSGDPTQVFVEDRIASFATTNVTVSFDAPAALARMQFYLNAQNLFNARPPLGAYSGNGTRAGLRDGFTVGDDPRGRFFTGGIRVRF